MPAHRNPLISPLHQSPIRRVTDNVFVSPLPATAHHGSSCPISPVSRSSQSIRIQYTSATVTNDLKALNSMMANHRGGGGMGRNLNNVPTGSSGIKRVGKRILQDVLEGDGGSCGSSSSSSASHGGGGVGGKMPCLSRKINDILADRNQFQQFSAAAAVAASLSAASANGSGAEDNNNSNDSLQFNLAGAGAGAVSEVPIRAGGSVLYVTNGVLTGIDMGGSPPTAATAAAPVMSSVAVE